MYREIWTDYNHNDNELVADKVSIRFKGKGSSSSTKRVIPNQTAEEAALQANATNYANSTLGTANNLIGNTNQVVGNFSDLYNKYNTTAAGINSGYQNLLNGELPSTYAAARQQALNSDLTGTVGSAINSLGSRGILNSSVTNNALDGITRNASDTLARNFSSDMSNYAGLLGNASANNASNLSNYTGLLSNQLGNANTAYNNTGDLFKTMYSGRMGTAGSTTTQNDGGAGTWQAIGSLGSAAILCFAGGTKIDTPDGKKNIEDIQVGDKVNSLDGAQTVTYVQPPMYSLDKYVTVKDGSKQVTTTSTQLFIFPDGDKYATELDHVPAEKCLVYDFSTTGSNTYYANGFLVRGCPQ